MLARRNFSAFVPAHSGPSGVELERLGAFVRSADGALAVLTGAGVSTESGIPDYRSEGVGRYATSNQRPITYQAFTSSRAARRRYWARSYVGFPAFARHAPNPVHHALAAWEASGILRGLITQNVDCLHSRAGSANVVELHGRLFAVRCLSCRCEFPRQAIQERMGAENPTWGGASSVVAPDGDVDLSDAEIAGFTAPTCPSCASDLIQPDVVFFGDNVRPSVRAEAEALVEDCSALLAVGTSAEVFSAYRLLLQAAKAGKPIAILNIGPTRADALAAMKISSAASLVLPRLPLSTDAASLSLP